MQRDEYKFWVYEKMSKLKWEEKIKWIKLNKSGRQKRITSVRWHKLIHVKIYTCKDWMCTHKHTYMCTYICMSHEKKGSRRMRTDKPQSPKGFAQGAVRLMWNNNDNDSNKPNRQINTHVYYILYKYMHTNIIKTYVPKSFPAARHSSAAAFQMLYYTYIRTFLCAHINKNFSFPSTSNRKRSKYTLTYTTSSF